MLFLNSKIFTLTLINTLINPGLSTPPKYQQSVLFGGGGGFEFSDLNNVPDSLIPKQLTIRGGRRLDQVSLELIDGPTFTHGKDGGDPKSLVFRYGELWDRATLCKGIRHGDFRNFYMKATSTMDVSIEVGRKTSDCRDFKAPPSWQIGGFYGRSADEVDQLGFVYVPIPSEGPFAPPPRLSRPPLFPTHHPPPYPPPGPH